MILSLQEPITAVFDNKEVDLIVKFRQLPHY